ncbi:unknown protein [Calothrix sp. PCC 7716]|nr:unknown protein [Calothrix sp. PCC 7716]
MVNIAVLNRALCTFVTSTPILIALATTHAERATAVLFNFKFDGTLTGIDPLGAEAISQPLNGNLVLDASVPNNSTTPIAGRFNGAIKDLNLTFPSTVNRNTVVFNTSDFLGTRNQIFVGARGTTEELQVLFGNVAPRPPFFQPSSVGIIFTTNDIPPTTQLDQFLTPTSGTFNGEFKLTLTSDQVSIPNNKYSGSFTISRVPEPGNIVAFFVLLNASIYLPNKGRKQKV